MDTNQKKIGKENTKDTDLQFAYIDRLIKATHLKVNIAETVLNVKRTLKEAQKKIPQGDLEVVTT